MDFISETVLITGTNYMRSSVFVMDKDFIGKTVLVGSTNFIDVSVLVDSTVLFPWTVLMRLHRLQAQRFLMRRRYVIRVMQDRECKRARG